MKQSCKNLLSNPASPASEGFWSNFLYLPIDVIDTTWSSLRSGSSRAKASDLRDMPIRVVQQDGRYEVIDGFKRLSRWKQAGIKEVPVLVEQCNDDLSPKRLLLESNSPKRTLGALDEARVVNSLIEDDGLTVRTVANLLGRRKEWIIGRRALLRLSSQAQLALSSGRINLMVARLLTAIGAEEQDAILAAVEKHGMKMREIQLLIQTWRAASDEERPGLLADPFFKRDQQQGSPSHSARLKALEAKLSAIRNALDEFSNMIIPADLADVEQRRLQAICISIQQQIIQMAQGFTTASLDAVPASPETCMPTNFQLLTDDDDLENFNDESEFFSGPLPALQCHLPSSSGLRCSL
ncbi:MAG: ParB N-terminal domain-containing protein [Candidatus Izemoplasmatales bacterium]|nr:ParB N-terminal domain-containing protein [Candidatus Izemoplasmatales bacterium]MDD5498911.1 ParB N-terminal domain-containing protein [Dehalococcoidales bacterium]